MVGKASDALIADPKARIRSVVQQGSDVDFSESVPLKRYWRSASECYRMASIYKEEGNTEHALILLTRYITLLVENAPKHPDYKMISKEEKQKSQKYLKEAFKTAENLKKQLEIDFEAEADNYLKEEEERKESEARLEEINRAAKDAVIASGGRADIGNEWTGKDVHPILVNTHDIAFPSFDATPSAPSISSENDSYGLPSYDRATKPKNLAAIGNSYEPSNSYGLRSVVVPNNLIGKFMSLVEKNTSMNVETCGVLCGKLANNRFIVTHLVIPKQRGTSDSCTTDHEEEVFDFQDKYDLITLGWIHTHPSQTAFLSSVDMHTHCSYQLMLPEAIAIVCSPRHNETGLFMLSPDFGLKQISTCRQSGFHPHEQNPPLFITCPHAGLSDSHNAAIVDFRNPE